MSVLAGVLGRVGHRASAGECHGGGAAAVAQAQDLEALIGLLFLAISFPLLPVLVDSLPLWRLVES